MKLIKDDERGKVYETKHFQIFYRKKDSVSGDNDVNEYENIYLISGEIELTIGDKTETITAPANFEIPEKTHHKILALSDIEFIIMD